MAGPPEAFHYTLIHTEFSFRYNASRSVASFAYWAESPVSCYTPQKEEACD